jgi:hypothetical protein
MARTFYGEQIEALQKAIELCKQGGCNGAVPFIINRIKWMQRNDWDMTEESNKPSNYV